MSDSNRPSLDEYWKALDEVLPTFSADEQRAGVALYRKLAEGEPLTASELAGPLGIGETEAETLFDRPALKGFTYSENGRILGFGGLAIGPMPHRFRVGERQLWTWCAWDSLFIPEILGEQATAESADPVTKQIIRLTVPPSGAPTADPESAVVSFVTPDPEVLRTSTQNVMSGFCHFVFFFGSRESGEQWITTHPGTFLYSVEEASELARRLNRRNFPLALELPAAV